MTRNIKNRGFRGSCRNSVANCVFYIYVCVIGWVEPSPQIAWWDLFCIEVLVPGISFQPTSNADKTQILFLKVTEAGTDESHLDIMLLLLFLWAFGLFLFILWCRGCETIFLVCFHSRLLASCVKAVSSLYLSGILFLCWHYVTLIVVCCCLISPRIAVSPLFLVFMQS